MTLPVQVTGSNHDPSLFRPRGSSGFSRSTTRITDRPGLPVWPPPRGWSQLLLLKLIDPITVSLYLLLHLSLGGAFSHLYTQLYFAVTLRLLKL